MSTIGEVAGAQRPAGRRRRERRAATALVVAVLASGLGPALPRAAEASEPGEPTVVVTARWESAPGAAVARPDALFHHEGTDTVHLVVPAGPDGAPRVQALDGTTLDPLAVRARLAPTPSDLSAFDPATGTVFVVEGPDTVHALTIDRETGTYHERVVGPVAAGDLRRLAWDPVGDRLLAIVGSTPSVQLVVYRVVEGSWTSTGHPLPEPPGRLAIGGDDGASNPGPAMAVASDGSILVGGEGGIARFVPQPDGTIARAGDHTVAGFGRGYRVAPGPDGIVWATDGQRAVRLTIRPDGAMVPSSPVIDASDRPLRGLAVDPTDGTLWGTPADGSLLVGVDGDGVVVRQGVAPSVGAGATAAAPGHVLYRAYRPGPTGTVGVARLERSVSPPVTAPPSDSPDAGSGAGDAAPAPVPAAAPGPPGPDDVVPLTATRPGGPGEAARGGSDDDEQVLAVDVVEPGSGELLWSISGADRTVVLSEAVAAGGHWHSTGSIHPVVVTDTRPGGPAWSISGQVSDFTGGLPGRYLGWSPRVIGAGAGAVAGAPVASGLGGGDGLRVPSPLAGAAAGHDLGTATLGADLDLRLPVETAPGTYTATLTITALS